METLGVIAGNRSLPLIFAAEARRQGVKRLVAVAFEGETDPALAQLVDEIVWLRVGQLGSMIKAFTEHGVKQCVMVGQIAPKNLFELRPDLRALTALMRLKERNPHTIFGAIAEELRKDGVELIEATLWLRELMPAAGHIAGPKPSKEQQEDIAFGLRIARETSRLDIGQTVVVKNGTVLAVEAHEGTDPCIRRGGELAGPEGGAVVVKLAKPGHDMRFDLPCIGPTTIETCQGARVAALAVEGGKTLLLEKETLFKATAQARICLLAV
jgi:hypothetical protein